MARKGRSAANRARGRDRGSIASGFAAPRAFDEAWLERIRERFDARYIDLTRLSDRRRWHPANLDAVPKVSVPRGLRFRPRIIIVPEGHKLARFQTYGGRVSLRALKYGWKIRPRNLPHHWVRTMPHEWPYGAVPGYQRGPDVSRRVGFALPWQVIICVRRKRRKEVMHALGIAGKKGVGAGKKQYRDEWSNVRC